MSRTREILTASPPRDDPVSPEELSRHDGSNPDVPVYVAIKGIVFDVTPRREMYEPGKGYHIFAGKDASCALGKSSLDPKDAVADTSSLTDEENKVLNDWLDYYTKRYNIVGKVVST